MAADAGYHPRESIDTTFRQIVSPIPPEEFFRAIFEQRPVHIPGAPEKVEDIFSWAEFNRLLNMSKLWSDRSMKIVLDGQNLDLAEHGRVGQTREGYQAIMPHAEEITALLRRGATVYRVRSLGVRVDAAGDGPAVQTPGGSLPLKPEEESAALWILSRDYVDGVELEERFAVLGVDGLRDFLARLEQASVLDKI